MYHCAIFLYWVFIKIFYRHKIYGKKKLKATQGVGGIIAANHTSYLDPPIIGVSAYPEKIHFLGKEGLFNRPIFAWVLRQLNTHPVAKGAGNLGTIKMACEFILSGKKVVIFPEGGRSLTGEFQKPQIGVGLLVLKTKCPVVPVYLHGTFDAWPTQKKWPKLSGRTVCVFGSPLHFDFSQAKDKKEMQIFISNSVMEAIANLKTWYLNGAEGNPP